jgi:uncharacterized Zn-binding protein involved in type VI secretion
MAAGTRLQDYCTGHDACAPTPLVESSPNVFINGRGVGRVGDHYAPHGCVVHPTHQDNINAGSATVFINGISAGRIGDAVVLAGNVRDGSANVIIGG